MLKHLNHVLLDSSHVNLRQIPIETRPQHRNTDRHLKSQLAGFCNSPIRPFHSLIGESGQPQSVRHDSEEVGAAIDSAASDEGKSRFFGIAFEACVEMHSDF